jgi:hypothetical protein
MYFTTFVDAAGTRFTEQFDDIGAAREYAIEELHRMDLLTDALQGAINAFGSHFATALPQGFFLSIETAEIALAHAFARRLREELTGSEIMEVVALNAAESTPDVCHSHDFCDSNMTMLEALAGLLQVDPDAVDLEEHIELMNAARDIAVFNAFFTAE